MSIPQQHPSTFGAGSDLPPLHPGPETLAGPSRRPRNVRDGLNDAGMSGPPSRSPRRARHISWTRTRSASSLPPPESTGSNRGHARGASSEGPGMGHRGSVSVPNHHRHGGPVAVKFRLVRGTHSGISVTQALNRERLSQSKKYLLQDIAPNMGHSITLSVNVSFLPLAILSSLVTVNTRPNITGCCVSSRMAAPRIRTPFH
jgi:hypothetical protein